MLAACLLVPAVAAASPPKLNVKLVGKTGQSGFPQPGFVRTSNGTLHVVYATKTPWGNSVYGVAATSISPSGHIGATVQAVSGWDTGIPSITTYPSGDLSIFFGGGTRNGSTGSDYGPWQMKSANGGSSWTSPVDVRANPTLEGASNDTTVGLVAGKPVLTLPGAGDLVVQRGIGGGPSSVLKVNTTINNGVGFVSSAVDASSGVMIASWASNQSPGGNWYRQVAPTLGTAHKVGGVFHFGQQGLVLAGRSSGPGVYAAYAPSTSNSATDETGVRLAHYGGSSIGVGKVKGLGASAVGVATGIGGRIWVMWWGQISGVGTLAVTRSNRKVTRFEPIQKYTLPASYMARLSGDGRLGPLDLLIGETPLSSTSKALAAGIYWARVLPMLSAHAHVKAKKKHGHVASYQVTVKVADAGDAVSGAKVKIGKHSTKSNAKGVAKLKLPGKTPAKSKLVVTHSGYGKLGAKIHL